MANYQFLPSWSSQSTVPEANAYAALKAYIDRLMQVGSRPFEEYKGQLIAGFTPDQLAAFQGVRNLQGSWQPYINDAKGLINNSVNMMGRDFGSSLKTYMDPYVDSVVKSTMANARESDAQAASKLTGNAIMQGGIGGDRLGVQKAELGRQQSLANNDLVSKLYSGAYNNAAGMLQNAATMGMSAASGMAGLGQQALNSGLTGINALLQSGNQQQGLEQQRLQMGYNQWNQRQQFPYMQTQWLGNLLNSVAPNLGSWTAGWQINPVREDSGGGGNRANGILGALTAGLGALGQLPLGSLFAMSDEREKTDVRRVGNDKATGLDVYSYRYRGDPKSYPKVVGPMAQDVEEKYPDAVREIAGRKAVDFGRIGKAGGGGMGGGLGGLFDGAMSYIPETQVVPSHGLIQHNLSFGTGASGAQGGGGGGGKGVDFAGAATGLAKGLGGLFKGFNFGANTPTELPGAKMAGAPQQVGDIVQPDAPTATDYPMSTRWGDNVPLPPRRPSFYSDTMPGGLAPLGRGFTGFGGAPAETPLSRTRNEDFNPFRIYADGGRVGLAGGGGERETFDLPPGVANHPQALKIARWASELGLNPRQAVAVAHSEGLTNPVGDNGRSLGSLQLYTGGGWGNDFQKETGIRLTPESIRDPAIRDRADRWALERVAREGGFKPNIFHGMTNRVYARDMGLAPVAAYAQNSAPRGLAAPARGESSSAGLGDLMKYLKEDPAEAKESDDGRFLSPETSQALMAAGFAMMASPHKDVWRTIGEGGLTGLSAYGASQKGSLERDIHKAQIENYRDEARHRKFDDAYKIFQMQREAEQLQGIFGGGGAGRFSVTGAPAGAGDAPGTPVDLTKGPLVEGRSSGSPSAPAGKADPFADLQRLAAEHDYLTQQLQRVTSPNVRAAVESRIKGIEWQIQQGQGRVADMTPEERAAAKVDPNYVGPVQRKYTGEIIMPGKAQSVVNIDQKAEGVGKQEMAKEYAKVFFKTRDDNAAASKRIQTLSQMKRLADDPNFNSGFAEKTFLDIKKAGEAVGLFDKGVSKPEELFQSLSNRLVTEAAGGGLGQGISNADVTFMQMQNPNLGMTPAANKAMIDIGIKIAKRQQEVYRKAIKYAADHGTLDPGFDAMIEEYAEANPIITEDEKAVISAAQGAAAGAPAEGQQQSAPPPSGGGAVGIRSRAQRLPPPPKLVEAVREAMRGGMTKEEILREIEQKSPGRYDTSVIFAQ